MKLGELGLPYRSSATDFTCLQARIPCWSFPALALSARKGERYVEQWPD